MDRTTSLPAMAITNVKLSKEKPKGNGLSNTTSMVMSTCSRVSFVIVMLANSMVGVKKGAPGSAFCACSLLIQCPKKTPHSRTSNAQMILRIGRKAQRSWPAAVSLFLRRARSILMRPRVNEQNMRKSTTKKMILEITVLPITSVTTPTIRLRKESNSTDRADLLRIQCRISILLLLVVIVSIVDLLMVHGWPCELLRKDCVSVGTGKALFKFRGC